MLRYDDAYKKMVDDNIRMRCNFWKEGEYVGVNPQKPNDVPNKDMFVKFVDKGARSYAWTPSQLESFDYVWEEYQG